MSKKSEKNCRKDNAVNTTIQTVETAKMKLRISRLSTLIPQKSETTNKI